MDDTAQELSDGLHRVFHAYTYLLPSYHPSDPDQPFFLYPLRPGSLCKCFCPQSSRYTHFGRRAKRDQRSFQSEHCTVQAGRSWGWCQQSQLGSQPCASGRAGKIARGELQHR